MHDVHTDPQADPDHLVVSVTVHGEALWGTTGRFRAIYHVWWEQA